MAAVSETYVPHLGWLSHPPDDQVARFLAEGWFEYREQAFWWLYLRAGDTVIDAGAHVGLYSVLASLLVGEHGRVLALEANPNNLDFARRNCVLANATRFEAIHAALSCRPGPVDFFPGDGENAAYGGLVAERPGEAPIRVPACTLDTLCRERGLERVALAKVDVEGEEIEVLRGARESIAGGVLPLWMIEFTEANLQRRGLSTRDLFEECVAQGYTVCRFDPLRSRLAPVTWQEPVWYDNYFLTTDLDQVNGRLAGCDAGRARIARDILRRGAAASAVHQAAGQHAQAQARLQETERLLEIAQTRAEEANRRVESSQQLAAAADRRIEDANRRLDDAHAVAQEAHRHAEEAAGCAAAAEERAIEFHRQMEESWRRIGEANWRADEALKRAEEAHRQLEESWRRIGEANWRAEEAVKRAEAANCRADAAHRRMETSDRRAGNARYETDLARIRLREILGNPAVELAWKLHLGRKPEWVAPFLATAGDLTPPDAQSSDTRNDMDRALHHLVAKNFRPRVVMDIGAGKGYWSLNAHTFFPEAEYFLVEPLDENAEELRRITERDPRFHFVRTALGEAAGKVEIDVTPGLVDSSCLRLPNADPARRRRVEVRSADDLLGDGAVTAPDLIKIDVQGYEMKVLAGAERALQTAEVLVVEVNLFRFMPDCPLAHEVIGYLAARGFVLFDLAGQLRRPHEDDLGQVDLVFAAAKSPLVASSRWD